MGPNGVWKRERERDFCLRDESSESDQPGMAEHSKVSSVGREEEVECACRGERAEEGAPRE